MAVSEEMINRIMGAPDSVTGKLVAMRRTPGDGQLETGVWYSNFTRVKTEAEKRGIPFFAMWTNGDLCGFCRRFTANILEKDFLSRMKTSGGLWWLGGSMDDNDEDRRDGIGFNWCRGPEQKVSYFPFFAVVHSSEGTVLTSFYGSGGDYDNKETAPAGTKKIIAKMAEIFEKEPKYDTSRPAPSRTPIVHIRHNKEWDVDHIRRFHAALRDNGGYCPCRAEKNGDTMCMCKEFMDQGMPGVCRCGAFEKYLA